MKIDEIANDKKLEFNMRGNILDLKQQFSELKTNILSWSYDKCVGETPKIEKELDTLLAYIGRAIDIFSQIPDDEEATNYISSYKNLISQIKYAKMAINRKDFTWAEIKL
jgi:hypothetical protein